jgi:oligopeptide transport system substrate-binding protein
MPARFRELVPWLLVVALFAAVGRAFWLPSEPDADFTFVNVTEPKSLDPQLITGQPEGRIAWALFDRLVRWNPDTLEVMPALAERWDVSDDQRQYVFHLRKDAVWSDGVPIDAPGIEAAWQRFLDPATAAEYSYQLWPVRGARAYSVGLVATGDRIEVELDRQDPERPFARGPLVRGEATWVGFLTSDGTRQASEGPALFGGSDEEAVLVELDGVLYASPDHPLVAAGEATAARAALPDFATTVGIRATDTHTLVVELAEPTPYFLHVCGFYPLSPVPMHVIEQHGSPGWTKTDTIVCSGPYTLHSRRLRDRVRLVRNEKSYRADEVSLEVVDALAIDSGATALALFETAAVDWATNLPPFAAKLFIERDDPTLRLRSELSIGFYRLNTTRPPLDDARVRQALSRSLDRATIVKAVYGPGQPTSLSFVPEGMQAATGYAPVQTAAEDAEEAARLLAEAGYPGGKGFPKITITFNADEGHQMMAELIQAQWKSRLGIDVELASMEWGAFLDAQSRLDYWVARAGWTADYVDPNTFLDMFVTDGANNQTGFSSTDYDRLIAQASRTPAGEERDAVFSEAEAILMKELPVLPLFMRVSKNLVAPWVTAFPENPLDIHPLEAIRVDPAARDRARRARRLRGGGE